MAPYIHSVHEGIHILDLTKTRKALLEAAEFLKKTAAEGREIVFVGTKRQAREIVKKEAERAGVHYINERWLGGFLTNFDEVKKRIERLNNLSQKMAAGEFDHYTKKERLLIAREIKKLERNFGGVQHLTELPSVVVLASARKEKVAVEEARLSGVATVAVVDTNADPTYVTYPIPANDDSRRSLALIFKILADAILAGKGVSVEEQEPSDSLESLGLSQRTLRALAREGIQSVDELKKMSRKELLAIKGLGPKSVEKLVAKIGAN